MLLKEFFSYDSGSMINDRRYDSSRDISVVNNGESRKIKLTLKQINQLRQQSEAHEFEKESEYEFIKQMYGTPAEAAEQAPTG